MTHLDLFSGIGGFALAAQTVWGSDYHCVGFCEIDPFCQQVLRKNFEGVNIYGDIRGLTAERLAADTAGTRQPEEGGQIRPDNGKVLSENRERLWDVSDTGDCTVDLLTGGFPCQPFSTAGKRKGMQDDRFLWPEMLRVVREVKPHFIIGENVAGIIEMALGQVVADLEGLGYEVQCFVIPACAVNAPHRRDRVWIVAYARSQRLCRQGVCKEQSGRAETISTGEDDGFACNPESECCGGKQDGVSREPWGAGLTDGGCPSSDPCREELEGCEETRDAGSRRETSEQRPGEFPESRTFPDWSRDWREVAALTCVHRVDDGLPRRVVRFSDGSTISESKWRQEALKAYGNSIVPQVAMEIMRAIKAIDEVAA